MGISGSATNSQAVDPTPVDDYEQQETYDPQSKPPPFGRHLKKFFAFEKEFVNLNHGSYGSLPLPVMAKCAKLSLQSERNPDKFHRFEYMAMLDEARASVAKLVGAELDEVVFVPNATHGINTVLRNFEWKEGDIIIGATTTYGAVARTIRYLSDRSEAPRPTSYIVTYQFPMTPTQVIDAFRTRIREIKQQHPDSDFTDVPESALPSRQLEAGEKPKNKFVAVIDSITSNPGVLLPWKELVKICHEEGIWTVVDAAHSIGQETNLNLTDAKPDFWVSNCHKWLFAKRGCAAFYVPKRNHYIIKSSIPTSFGYVSPSDPFTGELGAPGTNFAGQHEWTGTADFIPYLSVTPALEFRKWLGGEEAINEYCHKLAAEGGKRLAELLGTKLMDETGEQTLSMTNVMLPLPVEGPGVAPGSLYTAEVKTKVEQTFNKKLLYEWNTYVAHFYHNGAWWCRCSAQVWNEVSDFEYAAIALLALCQEINDTVFTNKASNDAVKDSDGGVQSRKKLDPHLL